MPEACVDVAVVGSGISSTLLVLRLMDRLLETPQPRPMHVLVLERDQQFFTGIPYGKRSGATSLIITPLDEFLPPDELDRFVTWLKIHSSWALDETKRHRGALTAEWLDRAKHAIADGDCRRLHVPRYLFGVYLTAEIEAKAALAEAEGAAVLTVRQADVTRVEKIIAVDQTESLRYRLTAGPDQFLARRVVLAMGMPPTRSIFPSEAVGGALLVEDPYAGGIDQTLDGIASHLAASSAAPGITVVGANAGSLEMLYQLSNTPGVAERRPKITVLSPQGRLPERYAAVPNPSYVAANLDRLADADDRPDGADRPEPRVTAASILAAARLDIDTARREKVSIANSLPPISSAVGRLLPRLDADELLRFAAGPGIEIGRLQRRAGDEYCEAADALTRSGQLDLVAGSFDHVAPAADGAVCVAYRSAEDGSVKSIPQAQSVVINCSGSAGLERPNQSALIESLLADGLCRPSTSGQGFAVNDRFEADNGLYVHGPMLAGNVVCGNAIWHVEHCGRIMGLSGRLADQILEDLGADTVLSDNLSVTLDNSV